MMTSILTKVKKSFIEDWIEFQRKFGEERIDWKLSEERRDEEWEWENREDKHLILDIIYEWMRGSSIKSDWKYA